MENQLFKQKIQKEFIVLSTQFRKFKNQYFSKAISKSKIQNYCRSSNFLSQAISSFTKNCSQYFTYNIKQNICLMNTFLNNDLTTKISFLAKENNNQLSDQNKVFKKNTCHICSQQIRQVEVNLKRKELQNDASNRIALMKKMYGQMQKQQDLFTIEEDKAFFQLLNRHLTKKEEAVQIQSKEINTFIQEVTNSLNDLNFLTQYTPSSIDFKSINSSFQGTLRENFKQQLQKKFKSKFPPWIQKFFSKFKQIIIKDFHKNKLQIAIQTDGDKSQSLASSKQQINKLKKQNQQLKNQVQKCKQTIFSLQHKFQFFQKDKKNSQSYYMEQISKIYKQKKTLQLSLSKKGQKKKNESTTKLQQTFTQKQIHISNNQSKQIQQNKSRAIQEQKQRQKRKKKKLNKINKLNKQSSKNIQPLNQLKLSHQQSLINLQDKQNQDPIIYQSQAETLQTNNNIQSIKKIENFLKNVKSKQKKQNIQFVKQSKEKTKQQQEKVKQQEKLVKKQSMKESKKNIKQKGVQSQHSSHNFHKRQFSIQKTYEDYPTQQILKLKKKPSIKKRLKQRPSIAFNIQCQLEKQNQIQTINHQKSELNDQSRKKINQIGQQLQSKAVDMLKISAKHLPSQMKQYVKYKIKDKKKKKSSYFRRESSLQNQIIQNDKAQFLVFQQLKIDESVQTDPWQIIQKKELQKTDIQEKVQKNLKKLQLEIIDQAEQYHRKKMLQILKKQKIVPGDLSISHFQLLIKKIFQQNSFKNENEKLNNIKKSWKTNRQIISKSNQKSLLILSLPKLHTKVASKLNKTGRQRKHQEQPLKSQSYFNQKVGFDENHKQKDKEVQIFDEKDFKLFLDQNIAYDYEARSKNNFHKKKKACLSKNQSQYLESLYKMINLIKEKNIQAYKKICSFIRYPYQTIKKTFQIINISKQISQQAFMSYFQKIVVYHNLCSKGQNSFCSHIDMFVQKISQLLISQSLKNEV